MNKDVQLQAMRLAANEMNMTENQFAQAFIARMLGDDTVPVELKKELLNIQQEENKHE